MLILKEAFPTLQPFNTSSTLHSYSIAFFSIALIFHLISINNHVHLIDGVVLACESSLFIIYNFTLLYLQFVMYEDQMKVHIAFVLELSSYLSILVRVIIILWTKITSNRQFSTIQWN